MGMDLNGAGGYFRFNNVGWDKALELARLYGWMPSGTEVPAALVAAAEVAREWDGRYHSNDGQVVTAGDALALAAALETALDDLPEHHVVEEGPHPAMDALAVAIRRAVPDLELVAHGHPPDASPVAFWSGPEYKAHLRAFIDYCRAGSFNIW
jgi:hypothetical protein